MIPMDLGMEAALNYGTPGSAAAGTGAKATLGAGGRAGRAPAPESASFQNELQAACRSGRPSSTAGAASGRKDFTGEKAVGPQRPKAEPASGGRENPVDAPAAAETASLLLQLLQGADSPGVAPAAMPEPDAAAEEGAASEDAAADMLARVLELLKQLASSANGASLKDHPDMTRLAEVLDQIDQLSCAARPASLTGQVHHLLADLHAHLSGAAWGKMVKEATAGDVPASAEPAETSSPGRDAAPEGTTPTHVENRPGAAGPGTVRAMPPPVPVGSEFKVASAEPRPASPTGASTAGAAHAKAEGEPPDAPHASSVFPAAAGSGAGRRGAQAAETPRPEMPNADTAAAAAATREEPSTDMSGDRSSTGDRMLSKDLGGADAAADGETQAADAADRSVPDPRLTRLPETGPGRAAEAVAAGKEKEGAAGAHRTGLFDQIVQRAVVQVRNDQSEVKIDLKPDFLGNVRMQILTENQQVSVRITTEFPAVRDMIEAGLQQLKSELQNQGLHVDRLEVSVSDDPHKQSRRQAKPDANSRSGAAEGVFSTDRRAAENRLEPVYYRARPGGAATIDMFA
jgi:hypothetical protein